MTAESLAFNGHGTRAHAKLTFPNGYRARVEFDSERGVYAVETRNEFDFPLRIVRDLTMEDVSRELQRIRSQSSADC